MGLQQILGGFIHEKESRQTIFGYAYNGDARSIAPGRLRRGNSNGNTGSAGKDGNAGTPAASEGAAKAADTGIDTSKKVELQFYMLGDAPKDLPAIQAEVNKMAEADLNATVKFNFTSWTDWDQKYKLLLSSGQAIDLIFTADWTQYQSYAKRGAFLALDDLLPKAASELQKFVPEKMWEDVKVDGKIYTVPATFKEYVTNGFVYREDLRKNTISRSPRTWPAMRLTWTALSKTSRI